jgi:hypothetical protein
VEVNSRIRETRSNQERKHQMILLEVLPRLTGDRSNRESLENQAAAGV